MKNNEIIPQYIQDEINNLIKKKSSYTKEEIDQIKRDFDHVIEQRKQLEEAEKYGAIPRANSGDIGREKKRKAKKWFSRKYYSSVLNLRDFLADNIGQSFVGVVAQALDDNYRRYNH